MFRSIAHLCDVVRPNLRKAIRFFIFRQYIRFLLLDLFLLLSLYNIPYLTMFIIDPTALYLDYKFNRNPENFVRNSREYLLYPLSYGTKYITVIVVFLVVRRCECQDEKSVFDLRTHIRTYACSVVFAKIMQVLSVF